MAEENNETVNAVIAQALENAGVPPRNIDVPSDKELGQSDNTLSLDGLPKGAVKGSGLDEVEVKTETSGTETKTPIESKPDESTELPLGRADIEAAITEASSKFQSIMDKKINALTYQMQQTVGALNQFFQAQENPDISGLPENEQVLKRLQRLEKPAQPRIQVQPPTNEQSNSGQQFLANFVLATGLKVDDKRIDWAKEPGVTSEDGASRFLGSIKDALLEDQTKLIRGLKNDGDRVIKSLRKKTGVDKVSTNGPGGTGIPDVDKMTPMQKIEYGFAQQAELAQVEK